MAASDAQPAPDNTNTETPPPSKRKKPNSHAASTLHQQTLRNTQYTYLHLSLTTLPSSPSSSAAAPPLLDALTARTHLTSALRQFLGLHGTAIPVDILKLEDRDAWIRVPREDASAVVAAVGGWIGGEEGRRVGWRVKGRDEWLVRLVGGTGEGLFGD